MKTYPNPNRFELHDQAKAITRALIGALTGWECDLAPVSHVWHADDWTVASDADRPHVDITTPEGHHFGIHRATDTEVVAVLRAIGAPLDESETLAAIDAAFARFEVSR